MKPRNRKLLQISLVVGGFVALAALSVYLVTRTASELEAILFEFAYFLCCVGVALIAVFPFAGAVLVTLTFLNWQAVRTGLHLAAHRLSAKAAARNASHIYPCLQHFLYHVLGQNREFLRLPLGKDASCLVPCGYAPAYRSGCVFYRFKLVSPEPPEMELVLLRLIVQNYITSELMNYGIAGLPSIYQNKGVGVLPSVFVDRIFYDEGQHYLTFDILFVDNPDAAWYVGRAIQYEATPKQPKIEVTDSDL